MNIRFKIDNQGAITSSLVRNQGAFILSSLSRLTSKCRKYGSLCRTSVTTRDRLLTAAHSGQISLCEVVLQLLFITDHTNGLMSVRSRLYSRRHSIIDVPLAVAVSSISSIV